MNTPYVSVRLENYSMFIQMLIIFAQDLLHSTLEI